MPRIAAAALAIGLLAFPALAQPPSTAPATKAPDANAPAAEAKFGPDTTFRELAADPKARAIMDRHVPTVMMAYDAEMFPAAAPLKEVASSPEAQSAAGFTAEAYKAILEDLSKL